MKQLVTFIKMQIKQLGSVPLREWLISHLNVDAADLTELFGKPDQTPLAINERVPSFISRSSPDLLPLIIFYTYAPQSLSQELTGKLLAAPELTSTNEPGSSQLRLDEELNGLLTDYRAAWPIITALQKRGVYDLIPILHEADDQSLMSLERVSNRSDLTTLINTFLAKNSNELDAVDRNQLIQFLRQSDLTGWLTKYLESFRCESSNAMSLKLLTLAFNFTGSESDRLAEIKAFLADYPCAIHLETLQTIIYYYLAELKNKSLSPANNRFIPLLYLLLMHINVTEQSKLLHVLPQETLLLIIEQCLGGCTSIDIKFRETCNEVLYLFSTEGVLSDKSGLKVMSNRLTQLDADLFDTPERYQLAQEILADLNDSSADSFDGLWIEQLLTSPRFVAASTAKVLKQLTDRHLLLCMSLNYVEYSRLILAHKSNLPQYEEIQKSWDKVNRHYVNRPEANEYWLNKKNRLIKFISDRMSQTLLIQLEERCDELKSIDLNTAKSALKNLYDYYCQTLPSLRSDLWFGAAEYVSGFQELKLHTGWRRKKEVLFYDAKGESIGFISESNHALTIVEDEVVLVTTTDLAPIDSPLYDKQGMIIGYLSASGQIRDADPEQQNISIKLLIKEPEENLEQSPSGLNLFVQNIFLEESLDELYAQAFSPDRVLWLEKQISLLVRASEQNISSKTFSCLVTHHSKESLFSLLATLKHKGNAIRLFHSMVNHSETRELLFSSLYQADVHSFLDRQGAVVCFADMMVKYHDQPWFPESLSLFASYGKKQKKEDLLGDALNLLKSSAEQGESGAVLMSLIQSEAAIRVVLKEFLNDNPPEPIQQLKSHAIDKVTQYFSRKHLVVALQELNKIPEWEGCSLYRWILYLLDAQHSTFFPSLTTTDSWQSNELNDLSSFISRHLTKKNSADSDFSIGYRVLGELIFRSGHAGQVALFYNEKTFNPAIARLSFSRSFLERLVDKFWIPEGVKEHFADTVSRIRAWSDEKSSLKKELQSLHVLTDWRHLVNQTWQEINKKKLPVICAYLLSYSGDKKPLSFLLRDYFKSFERFADYLHPVVKLLEQFPHRDVSAVLFDVLEVLLIKNPLLLDRTTLHHMAHYYALKIQQKNIKFPQAEINLLAYFGKNKHYSLVQRGCEELAKNCDDQPLKKQVLKGAREAHVEAALSLRSERFYFPLIKIWKRFWHYGVQAKQQSSGIVLFCDEAITHPGRKGAAAKVSAPVLSGKISNAHLGFAEKHKQLLSLLATIKHSSAPSSLTVRPSQISQSLFHEVLPTKLPLQETAVAKEPAVVNI